MAGNSLYQAKCAAAVAAVLEERTMDLAAAKVGIGRATLFRWMRRPSFRKRLRAAQRAVTDAAIARVGGLMGKATEALERNLDCRDAAVETRAALGVIRLGIEGRESSDLAERVERLERLGAEGPGAGEHQ